MFKPVPKLQEKSVRALVEIVRRHHGLGPKLYVVSPSSKQWCYLNSTQIKPALKYIRSLNPQGEDMKYASAFYVAAPSVEIYVFVDEEASGLPEGAAEICKDVKTVDEFLDLVEPYFILAKDK